MRGVISLLATLVLVSSLFAGCGCLAADSYYAKPECAKYHTDWPVQYDDN
jgi:hypothetical protein